MLAVFGDLAVWLRETEQAGLFGCGPDFLGGVAVIEMPSGQHMLPGKRGAAIPQRREFWVELFRHLRSLNVWCDGEDDDNQGEENHGTDAVKQ